MKNSLEITRKYQFGYIFRHHIISALIVAVFEAVAGWKFLRRDAFIARPIASSIFALIYLGLMYGYARKLALLDKKSYTPLKPELKWGVMWGLMLAAIMALMLVLNKLNWTFFSNNNGLTNNAARVFEIVFLLWTAPFFGFVFYENGDMPVYVIAILLILPVAANILGYLAGMKNFDIIGKLDSLTLEKNDDEDDDE